ncbi:YerC/YecD family TrpR-related protein [Niallia oryzisoli]|uniref:YerC/YecD family TrpR-related protein n=1 Tax=Niallia oryzisoli TaxID=1737571 RepID=A0ABZ2CB37_9BACI
MDRKEELSSPMVKQLFHAILSLKTKQECIEFFEDLCTMNELKSFSQRLEVARMVRDGDTYMDIQVETGASSSSIKRIKRLIESEDSGYELVIHRIEESESLKVTR